MPLELPRRQFLIGATVVEGGLLIVALGLAWLLEVPLQPLLTPEPAAVIWGVGATIPLVLVFWLTYSRPKGGFRQMKDFLHQALGQPLAACRWYELLWVAALAGIGEEFLFRGVLQTWLNDSWGPWWGLIVANVVFALCHAISPTYLVMAFVMGLILSGLMDLPTGQPNLITPIITHALYDFVAFFVVARDWKKLQTLPGAENQEDSSSPMAEESET